MKWLETHKQLAIVIVVAMVVLLIIHKIVAHFDGVAHDRLVLAQQQVKEDLDKAKLQASQSNVDAAALQSQINTLYASNQALRDSIAQLRSQLTAQRQKDASMPPSDLANRWHTLVPDGQIKPVPDGLLADITASHSTVSALEEIPVLKSEKEKVEKNSSLKDETIARALKMRDDKQSELTTCQQIVRDDEKRCNDKISDIKHKALKHTFWGTVGGFISGVLFGVRL